MVNGKIVFGCLTMVACGLCAALAGGSGAGVLEAGATDASGEAVSSIAARHDHSLALTSTGSVYAWGINSSGQLGDGTSINSPLPKKITVGGVAVSSLVVGNDHSLALAPAGVVYAWGYNASGQLGDGTTTNRAAPTAAKVSSDYVFAANLSGISYDDYPALMASGGSYDYGSSFKTVATTAAAKWAAILVLHGSASGAAALVSSESKPDGVLGLSAIIGVVALGLAVVYRRRRKRGV